MQHLDGRELTLLAYVRTSLHLPTLLKLLALLQSLDILVYAANLLWYVDSLRAMLVTLLTTHTVVGLT